MNNELSESYIEIYAKEVLNEIKQNVENNKIKLKDEKETDQKMLEIIKSLCIDNNDSYSKDRIPFKMIQLGTNKDDNRLLNTLSLYYTALYNDNLKLLNKLLDNRFNFIYDNNGDLLLFVLDKRLSNSFEEEEYIQLLKDKLKVFKDFYYSLSFYKDIEMDDDECIKEFVTIIKENPSVTEFHIKTYEIDNLLTKKTIKYFGSRFILDATPFQKLYIISKINGTLSEKEIERLKNLMKNHNFSTEIKGETSLALRYFTDEELLMINENEEFLFIWYYDQNLDRVDYEGIKNKLYIKEQPEQKTRKRRKFNIFK